jgi:hypothetical protein
MDSGLPMGHNESSHVPFPTGNSSMSRSCIPFFSLLFFASAIAAAQAPSAAETRLRTAGIEPPAEGIKQYLETQVAGEAQRGVA